jgi:hypothetical protein
MFPFPSLRLDTSRRFVVFVRGRGFWRISPFRSLRLVTFVRGRAVCAFCAFCSLRTFGCRKAKICAATTSRLARVAPFFVNVTTLQEPCTDTASPSPSRNSSIATSPNATLIRSLCNHTYRQCGHLSFCGLRASQCRSESMFAMLRTNQRRCCLSPCGNHETFSIAGSNHRPQCRA